jgi:hypothetical protein
MNDMKINFEKIICINLKSVNTQQLFAICETYFVAFKVLYKSKSMGIDMKWITEDRQTIAYVVNGYFYMNDDFSISKEDQERIKTIKPLKTPKMPKTNLALNNYKDYLAEGYDIRTQSMDSKLKFLESKKEEIEKEELFEEEEIVVDIKSDLPVVLEVDSILDKIGKYGIDSITAEEKKFLDNIK